MLINSSMDIEKLSELMGGASTCAAKFMRQILIDECKRDTEEYSESEFSEAIETAKRFADENPDRFL